MSYDFNNTNYKQFLLDLDKVKVKTIYARITALRFDESPIETIEGRVTQGSINLDGDSAVRRTCSLTIVANEFDYSNYLWGMNTKFKLEIGVKNTINSAYPDIIWFKQGTYLISSFNTSRSTSSFTISIQGKDKMCQLNGEVSGSLNASIDFGTIQEQDSNGNLRIYKIPVKDIIKNVVHQYAGEPLHNIIINDIEDYGLELLEYRYDVPMYLYRKIDSSIFTNITLNGDTPCTAYTTRTVSNGNVIYSGQIEGVSKFSDLKTEHLEMLVEPGMGTSKPAYVKASDGEWHIAKVETGQTAGYRLTDLTYPGDLIGNIGESVTSILDKIKNMLGEFEYFYDLDGRFVFQRKQSFVNTLWSPAQNNSEDKSQDEAYYESFATSSASTYEFSEGELITAFNNNPNIANMRNDYSIWGERNGISGAKIPVHMRYAIDTKPTQYTSLGIELTKKDGSFTDDGLKINNYNLKHGTALTGQVSQVYKIGVCDWREIIYQMARDYNKYAHVFDDFELRVAQANEGLYPSGRTGYEQYYIDLASFWRELYYPDKNEYIENAKKSARLSNPSITESELTTIASNASETYDNTYYSKNIEDSDSKKYWNKNVYEHPELLNFWFDFLDTEGELQQYNVKNVGSRTKPINDTNVKSIYFRETPNIIFIKDQQEQSGVSGYKYIQIQDDSMFTISSQGQSAKNKLDALLYQHGYCTETATITTVPIYHLQPNIRVYVFDSKTKLNGDYIISKISIPLTYNGTMSLTATKAAEALY